MLFMVTEISPDVLGLGTGRAESGRALKMRLIRTIAKVKRKQRYYTDGLKTIFEICQKLSANNSGVGITYNGEKITVSEVESVNIKFSDGIVNDAVEETDLTIKKIDAGLMSKQNGIMLLEGMTEEEANEELLKIKADQGTFTSIIDTLDTRGGMYDNLQQDSEDLDQVVQ